MNSEPEYFNLDNEFREEASRLIARLEVVRRLEPGISLDRTESLRPITEGISLMLKMILALQSSFGECRMQTPYSRLHPVITADGQLKWCCNHDPEHCA